jgi:hypothetical protein
MGMTTSFRLPLTAAADGSGDGRREVRERCIEGDGRVQFNKEIGSR